MVPRFRFAVLEDAPLLAKLNAELIRDEGHRNAMSGPELERRMDGWLRADYRAALFALDAEPVIGYALWRLEPDHVYLRQLFVKAEWRRRGFGRATLTWLGANAWPGQPRVRVEVLVNNTRAIAFWRAVGFRDYSLVLEREGG